MSVMGCCLRWTVLFKVIPTNVLGCVMNETDSGRSYYGKYKKYSYYYQSERKDDKSTKAGAEKTASSKVDKAKSKKDNKRKRK